MRQFDSAQAREAVSGPVDTRQWVSYGTVAPDSPGAKSVIFTKEYGPLVSVKLHPSGVPVLCRVSHEVAGNGEGEWFPFVGGDEVIVAIPEGDETAGCVIFGRLNQEIDFWPTMVAGQDPRLNNFAFRRIRTPYIFELAGGYVLNCAIGESAAFFSIDSLGSVVISNTDKAFLALKPDFLGLQNGDGDVLMQIGVEAKQVVLEAAGTKFVLGGQLSSLYTFGTVQVGTAGQQAAWHATTVEAVVAIINAVFIAVGTATGGVTPLTGATLAAAVTAALAGPALGAAAAFPLAPFLAAIAAALKVPSVPGTSAGIGAPGLLIG